ncbi:LysR family transcriptional regulator [Paralcaligenes ureilyticus]|uniref:LysR family transcriptional regulator n=1 Tax=Paralcaligenes ureilyticus TaxID=627131 RepID=A0A4R3M547_9BURK|nr:LysR family transcriptional regulator [Paralcaligenes ureilyticus]TCT06335.1 LysR family transcriptional regulator [Paralcaligenes ureilyticus]
MVTFKQIEALYWISKLGSFNAAATQLHTTQSAVSKRIQELEGRFDVEIFDRSRRSACLTPKGEEVLRSAQLLLDTRNTLLAQLGAREVMFRRLRLGVTELTALTWLPILISSLRKQFPQLEIEPEVGLSQALYERLVDNTIDLIIVPDTFGDTRFMMTPLGKIENAWMFASGVMQAERSYTLSEIAEQTVIAQGKDSGMGIVYSQWFLANGVETPKVIVCSNLVAQIGLTVSGLGVSYLPKECLSHLVKKKILRIAKTSPRLPIMNYVAMYRPAQPIDFHGEVARMCQECCDFSRLVLQAPN